MFQQLWDYLLMPFKAVYRWFADPKKPPEYEMNVWLPGPELLEIPDFRTVPKQTRQFTPENHLSHTPDHSSPRLGPLLQPADVPPYLVPLCLPHGEF